MDNEDRDYDKKYFIVPENSRKAISFDVIKSWYIADGKSAEEIAEHSKLPLEKIKSLIEGENLPELRKAYIVQGVQKIQNTQLQQSHKLMDMENNFKKLRIIQLEKILEDHIAYYSRHGHFYKLHPVTGEILKNNDGISMQIKIPDISKELIQLKESVKLSEGVRQLLHRLDELINTGKPPELAEDPNTFDVTDYNNMFEPSEN